MDLVTAIMYLLVGIAVLLVGMRFMSGGLKKIAGRGLRRFFKKTQNNSFLGMGMGFVISTVIHSDATSALVIGFINAGVMTIVQGLAIILGGYIGTTVTGILASFSSLSFSLYLLSFAFIGIMMTFFKSEKIKSIGEILCGLGLLFFGLAVMKDAFGNKDINAFCTQMFGTISFPLLLFLIGVLVTALAQSSTAVTGIVIAMVGGGAVPLSSALYLALGATLGTVATTLLSSLNGNIEGKRTAVTAFVLRTISSLVALAIVWIFESPISDFFHMMAINGSDEFPLAMFLVMYNVIFMPLLIPLIKPVANLVCRTIRDKTDAKFNSVVKYIDDKLVNSPDIALMQAQKEIINMFDLAELNYVAGLKQVTDYNPDLSKEVIAREDEIDYLNNRITDFLIKVAPGAESRGERKVGAYFHVINDIERIGDHGFNFNETGGTMLNEDLHFSPAAIEEIKEMDAVLIDMFKLSRETFLDKKRDALKRLRAEEEKVHILKSNFYRNHYERVLRDECSHKMTPYISTLIVELERIADHLTNIGYSIINPTGDMDVEKLSARKKTKKS